MWGRSSKQCRAARRRRNRQWCLKQLQQDEWKPVMHPVSGKPWFYERVGVAREDIAKDKRGWIQLY